MKKILNILAMLFFIVGCVPIANKVVITPTEIPVTETPTNTPSSTSTITLTLTITQTPIPPCNDQELGDLEDPGVPLSTNRTDGPGYGFLKYDENQFYVYQKTMHNRVVTFAVQKGFGHYTEQQRISFSNYIFNTWAIEWKEFGGFPFKKYTIVVGNNLRYDADLTHSGEYGIGFESSMELTPMEYWAHGIYHAWIGNGFRQYNDERWLMEGFTTYYGNRQSGPKRNYINDMKNASLLFKEIVNSGNEVPLSSISNVNPFHMSTEEHYWKGALVAYILDLELKKTGHHIGEIARALYMKYGINSQGYPTDSEILKTFNRISGTDFTGFFKKYIFGIDPLPIDPSNFVWVCHDNNIYILPTAEPTPIPSLSITIDGSKGDWQGLPLTIDQIGDSVSKDTDITGYSYTQDENFLDIMVDTLDPITKNKATLDIGLYLHGKKFELNVNSDGTVWGGNYPEPWNPIPSILIAWKDVVEIQIPKKVFNNYKFVDINYISLFTDINGAWTSVDNIEK